MTLPFGHTPMAAFTGVSHQLPRQILTDARGPAALPTAGKFAVNLATKYGPKVVSSATSRTALHVNPIAFMGGITGGAASTIAANTDILTPAAITTMILLAIQYCAQPPITRKFLDSRANKKGITMVEEIVKFGLSALFFISCGKDVVSSSLHGWTLSSSLLLAGLPALLYATQGVLTYLGYQNTDSVSRM